VTDAGPSPPAKSTGVRLVVIGRVALLLAAAAAVAGGLMLGRRPAPGPVAADAPFFCPMHRQVRAAAPGSCPICGMALTLLASGPPPELTPYAVRAVRKQVIVQPIRAPARVDGARLITALLHRDELAVLAPDEKGTFTPAAVGRAPLPVQRRMAEPRPWDADTFEVSFELAGGAPDAEPAGAGTIAFAARRREEIKVPETAVLQSADGVHVLVASGDERTFHRRPVRIGRIAFGDVVITEGLALGDRVATRRVFYLDAERRLRDPDAQTIEVGR